jgi:hypothetical protein
MPRLLSAGLDDALAQSNTRLRSYSTLELIVPTDKETRAYYLATAALEFNGITWQPELREGGEVSANLAEDASEATIEIQNVDTFFGIELPKIREYLAAAEARVGEYFTDLDRGAEWQEILLTGLVTGLAPDEQSVRLTIIPDIYSSVSVGPFRFMRRSCQADYKSFECGRPATDPPTCDKTLNGNGGCLGRWGAQNVVRHMGAPFLDNQVFQKII